MKSNTTNFDKLDLKCMAELPLIIDVLASTGNKIARIFKPITEECEKILKYNMPNEWTLDANSSFNLQFFPFYDYGCEKKISIEALDNAFKVETNFYICKKSDKKLINFLYIYFGYNFTNTENEKVNHYYYSILKDPANDKFGGTINTHEFYKNILKFNKIYEINYEHPEKGGNIESIDINVKEHDVNNIQQAFEFFKTEILLPTLKNIK